MYFCFNYIQVRSIVWKLRWFDLCENLFQAATTNNGGKTPVVHLLFLFSFFADVGRFVDAVCDDPQ